MNRGTRAWRPSPPPIFRGKSGDVILEGRVKDGDTVKVGVEGGELSMGGQRVLSEAADD